MWSSVTLDLVAYCGVEVSVLSRALGRLCGDTFAVIDVAACGTGTKCQSLAYDTGSGLSVRDDPCVRVLCYVGVLVVVNVLWILCGWHEVGALVLPLYRLFAFLFIQARMCFVPPGPAPVGACFNPRC